MLAFLGNLGFTELLVIALICLLLFGARKLPELAHSMGSSVQAFKKGMREGADVATYRRWLRTFLALMALLLVGRFLRQAWLA